MYEELLQKVISLTKRRGFVFPGSEIYGGLANSWDYGPVGVELKNNIKQLWWKRYVHDRDDIVGMDSAIIMNSKVWKASGHTDTFSDPLVECDKCHSRFRADQKSIEEELREKQWAACPLCKAKGGDGKLVNPRQFNLMFKTNLGPIESDDSVVYLRPETAQGMFVDFKNVLETSRKKIPFGIAQIGKAFRNEITPGNFIFRTREFEQMEIEYFIPKPKTKSQWMKHFEKWRKDMLEWMELVGINLDKIHELEVPKEELAHYSKRTVDFEYEFPFGTKELYGLAYRTDFDLENHSEKSGENLSYREPDSDVEYIPHVIEPTWGVDRTFLAVLLEAYSEDGERVVLKLKPKLAPYKVAVFPLLKNKPELVRKAKSVFKNLSKDFSVTWDDRGNIGKRYLSQDEIGTPHCITVDFQTLEDNTFTIRDRDTTGQQRMTVGKFKSLLKKQLR